MQLLLSILNPLNILYLLKYMFAFPQLSYFLPIVIFSGYFAQYNLHLAKSSCSMMLERVNPTKRNNESQVRCTLILNDN